VSIHQRFFAGFVLATVKQQWAREASTELAEGTPASVGDKSDAALEDLSAAVRRGFNDPKLIEK
jgi:hypothetical protein